MLAHRTVGSSYKKPTVVQEGGNNRTRVRLLSKYQDTMPNYVS